MTHTFFCIVRDRYCANPPLDVLGNVGLAAGLSIPPAPGTEGPPLIEGLRSSEAGSSVMLISISRICSWRMLSLLSGIKYLRTSASAKAMRAWASAGGASAVISTCKSSDKCAYLGSKEARHSSSYE